MSKSYDAYPAIGFVIEAEDLIEHLLAGFEDEDGR